MLLQAGNDTYERDGTVLHNPAVTSDILETLADFIFSYTASPTGLQISAVVEALVKKYPCLNEPATSCSSLYGWQQRLKYKMNNYRSKLRKRDVPCPELDINSMKRKRPGDTNPVKSCKKPKRAEVNYLPPHPKGDTTESLEKIRLELIEDIKKNNERVIYPKMAQTFSYRRLEVVTDSPAADDFQRKVASTLYRSWGWFITIFKMVLTFVYDIEYLCRSVVFVLTDKRRVWENNHHSP